MKTLGRFARTTVISGALILLPLLLLYLALAEVGQLVMGLAAPIADLLPRSWFGDAAEPLAGLGLLLAASLVVGLLARSQAAQRFGNWIEARTLARIPLYPVLKGLAGALVELTDDRAFKPVLLTGEGGDREFAYLVEDHGDGHATVMLSRAPTPFAGSVKIVRSERLRTLDAGLGDVTRVLSHWGAGARALAGAGAPVSDAADAGPARSIPDRRSEGKEG